MDIIVRKPTTEELEQLNVFFWPTWEKEVSRFDWYYDHDEECYVLEGRVIVETQDGNKIEFGKGDFVIFPKGLACIWDVKEPIRKHYTLK